MEKEVFDTFKRLSQKIVFSHKNEWELLIDMQHYYIPTRLLDWSENLGIAIYFAIYSHTNNKDISLYVLNPLELNKYSKKQGIPIVPDDNMGLSYINNYIKKELFPPTYPIAIKSNFINERVMAQRGMFTVHGDDLTAIEKLVLHSDYIYFSKCTNISHSLFKNSFRNANFLFLLPNVLNWDKYNFA